MHLTGFVYGRHLLAVGLHGLEGVVYLDDQDRKMIVTRAGGMRPLLLADCHVPPDLRFTFYDQVHTTGEPLLTWLQRFFAALTGRGVIKLSPCGKRYYAGVPSVRFVRKVTVLFHVRCTGMDIKQGLSVVAAVTLGKDMTFRDYAQGAFRMRGIGKGQKVQVRSMQILTPFF